jgi:hypothetical protein
MRELQLIGFNLDRAAVQLGISPRSSRLAGGLPLKTEEWRKLAALLPLTPVETKPNSEQAQTEWTDRQTLALAR